MTENQTYNALIQQVVAAFASQGITVILIEGEKVCDKSSFLQEFAAKFHFPSYFGHNWDALHDCLTDLEWFHAQHILVVYPHAARFRISHPEDWQTAAQILFDAADYWKQRYIVFSILFL